MPELPEVETVRRNIEPHVAGRRVEYILVRNEKLRRPVPLELLTELPGRIIENVRRRGKYLLLRCGDRTVIIHLGMTGHLGVIAASLPPLKHDHLDIFLENGMSLRFNDPRRFGLVLWESGDPLHHPLLARIGPEPLEEGFTGKVLADRSRGRKIAVKQFIMDSTVVAGVGNIYASEALFRARLHPARSVDGILNEEWDRLASAIRETLEDAITDGGTTIRDFVVGENTPGYFTARLRVYDRTGKPCLSCGSPIILTRQGGRSTYFCTSCQR